ncbi:MAG TPA: EF-hand domain-containing protein [Nannocystaceae bacterium]|nr:EF-hand domain-containing protein [Nannocystaceae bacterium]
MQLLTRLATLLTAITVAAPALAEDGKPKDRAKDRFEDMDRDGNGKLTLQEFIAGRSREESVQAAKIFAKMDGDNDGIVTAAEFKAGAKHRNEK